MSFEALGFVTGHLFVKGCTLSPVERLTLISVAAATDAHGEGAFPGLAYLEETTGASRKTVQRSLANLAARGLLEDTGDRRGRTGRVVVWRMLLPAGTPKAAWPKHHQWRHRDLISAEPAQSPMASPVPDSPAANEDTVTPLNEDTVTSLDRVMVSTTTPNQDIDDNRALYRNQSGNQKTDPSLRSGSAADAAADTDPISREEARRHVTLTPDRLRLTMTSDGWTESDSTPWLFTRDGQRRDWLFEAVGEVVGLSTKDLTKNGRGRVNGALKQLRDVDADPLEVLRRGRRFVQARGRRPSIFELATLWAELGDAADDRFASGDTRHADAVARAARVVSG